MTHKEFKQQLAEMTDTELIHRAERWLSALCESGGKDFTMRVPAHLDDTDVIFGELIRRYKNTQKALSAIDNMVTHGLQLLGY